MSYDQVVLDQIESNRDEVIEFMQKLIQAKSVTGDETKVAALVAKASEEDGLKSSWLNLLRSG